MTLVIIIITIITTAILMMTRPPPEAKRSRAESGIKLVRNDEIVICSVTLSES